MGKVGLYSLCLVILYLPGISFMAVNGAVMKEDNRQVRRWNAFVDNVFKLHKQLINEQIHVIKTRLGGYANLPNFYKEQKFTNKKTGKLISRLQWEKKYPDNLHTIEVYIYGKFGRVIRDYSAAYLPDYRNAPVQTLINLHAYNGLLHAFRSFDASGAHILDRCTGRHNGKRINILLDEDDLHDGQFEKGGVMQSDTYLACFKDLPKTAGKYLTPR